MPIQWSFTPSPVNALAVMAGAKIAAEDAGAQVLLAKSQPLVPVDQGTLVASGQVVRDGEGAAVVYSATNPEDGYNYAVIQHERLDFHHEHGQAKYLEQPMHTEAGAIGEAMAQIVRRVLG